MKTFLQIDREFNDDNPFLPSKKENCVGREANIVKAASEQSVHFRLAVKSDGSRGKPSE